MKLSAACLRIVFATIAWWGCFLAVAIAQAPFITTWETTANNESITIPTYPFASYDYSVDWGDGQTDASITGDATHTYATAGVYTVSITGSIPRIYFNGSGDKDKLLTIEQWGDIAWTSMQYAFSGCSNLQVNATDAPNLSNCPNLTHMFNGASSLNADFNHWDISGVSSLSGMFINCSSFNGNIAGWNVSYVTDFAALFYNAASFNQPIGNWDVSKATTMVQMFFGASSFAQDISNWDVSNVTAMASMFSGASSFDQPIGQWNITNVSNMSLMLNGAGLSTSNYDATLMGWATQAVQPNVTLDANGLQYCAGETARDELINTHGWTFTGDSKSVDCGAFITVWQTTASNETITIPTHPAETYLYNVDWGDGSNDANVSGDATHTYTTAGTYTVKITGDFPQIYFANSGDKDKIYAITQWGDISWTSMVNAFNGCSNLAIDALDAPDLSGVTTMLGMFFNAKSITKGVAHWDVSQVDNMYALFSGATAFNDDLSGWNVSNVTNMAWMFRDATAFDQNLGEWNISDVTQMDLMLDNAGLSVNNYDATLDGWAGQAVVNGVTLGAANLEYCAAAFARQQLINTYGWNIVGDMQTWACYSPDLFITTWQTTASNETITIPTFDGETYNYTVDWGDGNTDVNITGDATHTYTTAGTYAVTISGTFPRIHFNNQGDREKILSVEQWGFIGWTSMHNAFFGCSNLQVNASDAPNLSGVTSMVSMFENCTTLDTDFNHWDVSAVEEMSRLFAGATQFNGDIGNWDIANVTSIGVMFQGASNFNQDISNWDVSNVTVLNHIFGGATAFNQPISNWNVGNVQHMDYAFAGATAFNQPIGNWNVSKVQYMEGTFSGATAFNQPIDVWDVSNATDMSYLFHGATAFNQNISGWNTGNVENMEWMFNGAINFQQDLSGWDVSSVTNMQRMFDGAAKFTSDLGGWDISQVTAMDDMLDGTFMTPYHYDATLIGWAKQQVQPNVALGAQGRRYCAGKEARDLLMNTHGWTITGDSQATDCGAFVTLWNTTNPGTSNSDQLTIPTFGAGYNYDIYWENFNDPSNNGTLTGQTGSVTITFPAQGMYWIRITGAFPHIRFNNAGDRLKLVEINAWGDIQWQSMQSAFWGCENLQLKALDVPDLSQVNDMSLMFAGCTNVNADLSGWDVSQVQDFFATFFGATLFNGDVTTWQLDNATNTASMFKLASQFNQDVSGWNTGNMTDMSEMFYDATAFDQQLGNWNIESVTTMDEMLRNTALSPANYDATLTDWAGQNVQSGVPLGALGLEYCAVEPRNNLINNSGWNITGDSQAANCLLPITGISFDNMTFTYDGTEHTLAITGPLPQGASVTYTNNGRTDAGSQTVTAFINGGTNYENLTLTATLTVTKATITGITFDDGSFTYDGTAHEITIGGSLPQDASVAYTDNTRTDAGSQTATAQINGGTNYDDLTLTATLTVTKATITGITFDDGYFTYDGTAHEITIGGSLPQDASVAYTDNTRTDAGSQTATAQINGGTNYDDLTLTATLTVTKATITGITFDDGTFTYDGTAHEITIGGTLPQGASVNYTDNTRTDAGSQTATAQINGGTNYNDLTLTATLTVTKATITGIAFDGGTFTYDGTAHEINIGGTLPQGTSVNYTDNTRTDAGSQTATAEINGGTNYNDLTLTATLTVSKATITGITFDDGTFTYDGTAHEITIGGTLPQGTSVAYTDNTRTDAGSQTASAEINGGTNYNELSLTAMLTVTPATHSINLPSLADMTYGDAPCPLPAVSSGGVEINWTSSDESVAVIEGGQLIIVGAGTTTITGTVPDNPNYSNTPKVLQPLAVAKAVQTIKFDAPASVDRNAGTIVLNVSATSNLPVTLTIDDELVAGLSGHTQLEIRRLGTVRIIASQPGDDDHLPAEPVTATIRVVDPASDIPVRVHPVISPNGDGINDFLIVEGIRDYPYNRLYIVNKNGTEVANIIGYNNANRTFRGIGSGGSQLPTGTYFYVLEVREDGQWKHKKGYFILRY